MKRRIVELVVDVLDDGTEITEPALVPVSELDALRAALAPTRRPVDIGQADPLTGVVADLRASCRGDGWHPLLSEQIGGMLAWPPESIENEVAGINSLAGILEELARGKKLVLDACLARDGIHLAQRVVCWGRIDDAAAELAEIDQVWWRRQNFIEQAHRDAADAIDAGFVRYLVAALRVPLAVTRVSWARAERDSYCDSYDNFESYQRFVLERPSRDADGVPLLSKSEIDRVVPAKFGIDDTWGAIPIGGELRARQTRAILVAAALYDTRQRQLLAAPHGTAISRMAACTSSAQKGDS